MEFRELITRATAQEELAWEALVENHKRLVWGILKKFKSLGVEGQEDLYQEVFATLAKGGLSRFHGETEWEFRVYLRTITENKIRDYVRSRARRPEASEEWEENAQPDPLWSNRQDPNPEESAVTRQLLQKAVSCLQELADIDRQIFLRRAEGYPYEDIAAVLDLPLGTIASKYHRAKAKVEDCLRRSGVLEGNAEKHVGEEKNS